jgi:hypothetical protein
MTLIPQNPNWQAIEDLSQPVALANEQVQDYMITGQAGQSTLWNNILLAVAWTATIDTMTTKWISVRSFYCQVIASAGISAWAIQFEWSNDNVTFVTLTIQDDAGISWTSVNAAISIAANTNKYFSWKITYRYIRCRIQTAFVWGTVQAITKFSSLDYFPRVFTVWSPTPTSFNTISQICYPIVSLDVASSALTTTTTTASISPTSGVSYEVNIPVTAVSGTNPTLDVVVQESDDWGTNWYDVYHFPRITTTGIYRSPKMAFTWYRIRHVQTVWGTTPSFTRAINRLQSSDAAPMFRQILDRAIVLTTLSTVTSSLIMWWAKNITLSINIWTTTIAPVLQIQWSDDNGATWYNIGSTLTSVASSTVSLTVNNISPQLARAIVTTAWTATVAWYVMLRCF